jgi:hypothetical protein
MPLVDRARAKSLDKSKASIPSGWNAVEAVSRGASLPGSGPFAAPLYNKVAQLLCFAQIRATVSTFNSYQCLIACDVLSGSPGSFPWTHLKVIQQDLTFPSKSSIRLRCAPATQAAS